MRILFTGILLLVLLTAAAGAKKVRQLIFEEQTIEGKIRRPQLVLITADQRPAFLPMALKGFDKREKFVNAVDQDVIEASPHAGSFRTFNLKVIINRR